MAIQVKKLKFSGKATDEGHLHGLLNQLSQALGEPIKLPDGNERKASRFWFISPFPLNVSALELSFSKYVSAMENRIRIIDGNKLINLIDKYIPEILSEFGDRFSLYRRKFSSEITLIKEAVAFRLSEKLSILPIYINLDLLIVPDLLARILNKTSTPVAIGNHSINTYFVDYWKEFEENCASLLGERPRLLNLHQTRHA